VRSLDFPSYQLSVVVDGTVHPVFSSRGKNRKPNNCRRKIGILTANVLATNRNAAALMDLIVTNRPDVVVTIESDTSWQARLDALVPDYPDTLKCPLDKFYGMHVYSRLPILQSQIKFLAEVESDVPSMHALVQLPLGQPVRIHCLHPSPPGPTDNETASERDAELFIVDKRVAH